MLATSTPPPALCLDVAGGAAVASRAMGDEFRYAHAGTQANPPGPGGTPRPVNEANVLRAFFRATGS